MEKRKLLEKCRNVSSFDPDTAPKIVPMNSIDDQFINGKDSSQNLISST